MYKIKKFLSRLTLFDGLIMTAAIMGAIFFAFILFRKAEFVTVTIKLDEDSVTYQPWYEDIGSRAWFSGLFYEGLQENDSLGRVVAEVVSINSYQTKPGREALFLNTRLKAVYNKASNQYTFKGLPLIVGSTIKINFNTVLVEGIITDMEGTPDVRERVKLKVSAQLKNENATYLETSGVSPAIANELQNVMALNDGNVNPLIQMINVRVEDAKKLTINSNGNIIVQRNPLRKDVYLELSIDAIKIDNRYYLFDDVPILIGLIIPLNTNKLSVFPEVTAISVDD